MHLADAAHTNVGLQVRVVEETLGEIGAGDIPSILAFNKTDLPDGKSAVKDLQKEIQELIVVV